MDANETYGVKRRFWNKKNLLVATTSAATVILLAGLLVAFSAPKNELLTEMPTQQSRLRFLGPLRQPVSAAWQRFRAAWLKPPPLVSFSSYQLEPNSGVLPDLGLPILASDSGVRVWLVQEDQIPAVLKRPGLVGFGFKDSSPAGSWTPLFTQKQPAFCRIQKRSSGSHELDVFVMPLNLPSNSSGKNAGSTGPTNPKPLKPFGAHVAVPKGSAVLLLGPKPEFGSTNQFAGLFVPE